MKKRYLLCLLLGLLFWGYSESCSLKEEGEKNRYILSNRFLTVEINADKGGGIENISYSPKDISLTDTSADMISFEDRIYSQSQKESGKAVDVEYFAKYPYTARVLKNTEREVSVEVSATALSEAFPGLTVRKIYSLKEDACALFVEHILENTSDSAVEAGIWSTNFFRIMGGLGERNIFYTPAEDGLRAVLHPGKDVKAGGNWTLYPSENWKGLTGELSKDGLVVIFEYRHLSCFYDWSSEKSKVSTFEWMIKEQRIEPKKSFSTKYVIMPVSECDRIDSVIGNRVACGIEYQPGKVKLGDDVDVRYCLSGYEKQKVTVKAKIESEGRIVKEFLREEIVLEAGKTHSDSLSFRIEKEGVYRAEIEVLEGNKVIGQAERQIFAGNFTVDAKPETGAGKKPEELFWMGMKTAGLSEWQDVKISQYRINPAMMKKDSEKNMVALGDFEETDEKKYAEQKWTIGLGKGAVLTDESAHGGRYSLKMQVPAGAKSPVFEIGTPLCKVEAGREYRVTFWAKASNAGGGKYVLFPSYYFYKGSMEKPEYTGRLFQMIQTPDFDWKEIERIIVIPEGVEWLRFFAATRATKGDIYIDDVKIVPVALSDKQERKERAFHFYKDLDIYFNVSEEYVTPHVRWLKPYTEGKIKVLYLAYMDRLDSTNKRDVVELNQRMDMDYKFIPLINRKTGERRSFTKEVEPYILDVVNEELEKDWEVVVVNNLDFKGVQDQLAIDLLEAVKRGKGLVLTGCKNLPEDMNKALTGADKIKIPANFYCIPEVNKTLRQEKQIPQIVSIRQVGKGRIAIINEKKGLYPCIPADKTGELSPNNYGREIPYWEYRMFPVIKSAVFTSGRESEARINSIACSGNLLEAKIESGTEVNGYMEVSFNDVYGQAEKREKYPVKLTAGSNELQFSLPVLPGGDHIADCKLTDSKSRIYDFWSFSFSVPFISKVTGISFARPYYSKTEEIKAHVKFENVTEGTLLSWYVEDTYERVIRKGRAELKAGDLKSDINFMIDNPLTILYRLFVSLEKENKTLSTKMEEFSMPFNLPADDELVGYGWFAHQGAHAYRAWKENGFGSLVNSTYWTGTAGVFKQLCNVNMRPCLYGQLYSAGNPDPGDKFRGDRATPEDSVRKPCFSDPDWWSKIKEESVKRMKDNKMVYYGIKDHSLGDECFLGADVCFSEWCLKDFREYLKKQYRDLK
ncbi:MAG TPA: hypothetical protein PKN36_07115, partial [bacterium]|nr:hypothetical protein [bacterium]